jgi:hypothetical protein
MSKKKVYSIRHAVLAAASVVQLFAQAERGIEVGIGMVLNGALASKVRELDGLNVVDSDLGSSIRSYATGNWE